MKNSHENRIIKSLENSGVIKGVNETVKHEIKKQEVRFVMSLGSLGASI